MSKNKKAGHPGFLVLVWQGSLVTLRQCFDALGAKVLANHVLTFTNGDGLDVRVELPAGCAHRKTALIAKLRLLATSFTHSHGRYCLDFA
jgi:hypothetical protein